MKVLPEGTVVSAFLFLCSKKHLLDLALCNVTIYLSLDLNLKRKIYGHYIYDIRAKIPG